MNGRKEFAAILFAAITILALAIVPTGATAQIAPPTVSKTVNPTDIVLLTEETTITLTIQGTGSEWTTSVPIDVVFALDSSGSMGWNDPSGLRKTAAKSFVDKLNSTTDQAGVVSWDNNIDFTQTLTNNFSLVKSKIDAVDSSGGTDLNVGLNAAISLLDTGKQANSSWVIIFLSNGQGTYSHSTAVVAANKGYTVYTIGLAISPGSTAESNLKDIANTTGGKYYSSPNATNLDAVFNDIYKEVVTSTIPHYVDVLEVTQSYIIDESSFNVAPDNVSTDQVTGETTIVWNNIGLLSGDGDPDLSADEIVTLSFKAKSSKSGMNLDVDVYGKAKVNYKDSNDADGGSVLIPQAKIDVKSARWLKQDAIAELEAINTTSKQAQHDINKAIKLIKESLNPALWVDDSRLDPKHGHKVFDREKHAVKELLKIVEERGKHADAAIVDEVKTVIDKITKADELLALIAITDAKNAEIVDPKFEKKVEQEIAKAEEELAKAYQALGADNPDKAIDHFKLAWKHAQLAIKFAQGLC
ncbi:vWA domain-containing protein [Archaeoglobus veneficus]|uniref:von Willebrand factor type A n=1 Tax=Archaeoglobus veneficus (strain DSM 11195 / SNP6) TaxID=693661 RepID=F2KMP9_ARCVS|nr:vWA domain-containing protein [Archaeoglobus veneficus]AEA46073.1 von Willebrand factor type A [Archaeoglobus veneficus SNP6]